MESIRCGQSAGPNWPGSEKFMLCSMCNGQMGNLSPGHPARDACTVCGEWVPSSRGAQPSQAFLCMQHKKMGVPGVEHCGLCKRSLQGVFEKGKSPAKLCTRCGFGIPKCSAINV